MDGHKVKGHVVLNNGTTIVKVAIVEGPRIALFLKQNPTDIVYESGQQIPKEDDVKIDALQDYWDVCLEFANIEKALLCYDSLFEKINEESRQRMIKMYNHVKDKVTITIEQRNNTFTYIKNTLVENRAAIKTKADLIQVLSKQSFTQYDDFDLERVLRWASYYLIISNIENYHTKLDICNIVLTNDYSTVQEILDYVHTYFHKTDVQCFTKELIEQEFEFIKKLKALGLPNPLES